MQNQQSPIITSDQLAKLLDDPKVKILDCSVSMGRSAGDCQRVNYHKNCIKGAQFLDLDNLRDMNTDLPFMMPSEKLFIDTMKRLNVKLSDKVVCYDSGAMQLFGYRAAWMFQAMRHPDVVILDGGLKKWMAEGKPIDVHDANVADDDFQYKMQP